MSSYQVLKAYILSEAKHRADPQQHPKPSLEFFNSYPAHGSVRDIVLKYRDDPDAQPMVGLSIFSKKKPEGNTARLFNSTDAAAIVLAVGVGMPLNINDNAGRGRGYSYPRFRIKHPRGQSIYVERVIVDAKPHEEVQQRTTNGTRMDYHDCGRDAFTTCPYVVDEKPSRPPEKGRPEFFAAVELYWTDNHAKAGIDVPLEEYLSLIMLALSLGDWAAA
ncbi:hypothetical protein LGR54_04470 [Ancylobacter sp. Lp-2]|uniref:hypothetical protein n=1 Tax=Ancylobacter sp. Lp-2 TaxID=2881339 RepID=UPI001E2BC6C3|nr:hypothetical protein [Ancylobacter sp. Lp-2]MCB4767849.1 hypothetical protein [Ancylobacter sp. Lp-2]